MTQTQWGKPALSCRNSCIDQIVVTDRIKSAMQDHFGCEYHYTSKENFYHDLSIVLNRINDVIEIISLDFSISKSAARAMVGILCHDWYEVTIKREAQKFKDRLSCSGAWGSNV